MNPIRWAGSSPARLSFVSLAALVALALLARAVADHVRVHSTSPGLDLILITVVMLLLFGVASLQAIWLGELLLRAPWRRTIMLGVPPESLVSVDASVRDAAAAIRSGRSERLKLSALVALAVLGDLYVVNRATAGFFDEYARVGYHRTALRGADPATRRALLLELADRSTDEVVRWVDVVIVPRLESTDEQERVDALAALWWVARRMTTSVDLLNAARARPDRWEYGLAQRLREEIGPLVVPLAAEGPEAQRTMALSVLGAARVDAARPTLVAAARSTQPVEAQIAALVALGRLGAPSGADVIVTRLSDPRVPPRVQEVGLWALGEIGERSLAGDADGARRPGRVPAEVEQASIWLAREIGGLPPAARCVAAGALSRLQDARAFEPAAALFEGEDATYDCPAIELPEVHGPPLVLSRAEPVRITLLRVIAGVSAGNPQARAWLAEQNQRQGAYPEEIRRELENLAHKVEESL